MTEQPTETIIRKAVRDRYAKLATIESCCSDDCCNDTADIDAQVASLPNEATQVAAGCGSPLAHAQVKEGQVVVDLGSGGGIDVFRAARLVGSNGRAIGIDATPEMIWRARETARKNGYVNAEFRLGEIEHIPLDEDSADWVVSNCVINLAPDKRAVFDDALRVLRSGGEMVVSDIVAEAPIPSAARKLMSGWSACLTGAIPESEYLQGLRESGFKEIRILEKSANLGFKLTEEVNLQKLKLVSLTMRAKKPLKHSK